jgi:hypothetical protein
VLLGLALSLASAACNRSSETSSQSSSTATTRPTISQSNEAHQAELRAVSDRFAASRFRATYLLSPQGGDPADTISGDLTLFKDGPARFRIDISSLEGEEPVELTFIVNGDDAFVCLRGDTALGGLVAGSGDGVCILSEEGDPALPATDLIDEFESVEVGNVRIVNREARTIAGAEGTCYTIEDGDTGDTGDTGETSTTCFTAAGILLARSGEGLNFEATSVGGDVAEADFTPPFVVQDVIEGE